jgi:hypothetical protein
VALSPETIKLLEASRDAYQDYVDGRLAEIDLTVEQLTRLNVGTSEVADEATEKASSAALEIINTTLGL